ncbi:MAG: YcxB family protein [Planctomycetota bacterium]|jgi:uncharacterized membrane protein
MKKVQYTLSRDEVREAVIGHLKTYKWSRVRPVMGAIFTVLFVIGIVRGAHFLPVSILSLLCAVYFFLANTIYIRRFVKILGPALEGQYTLEIENDRLKLSSDDSSSELNISHVKALVTHQSVIILYITRITFLVIPASAFQSEEDLEGFTDLFPKIAPNRI